MTTGKANNETYVKADPESADLPVQVFQAELESIKNRRGNFKLPPVDDDESSSGPEVQRGLYGLALSGGGIRSSTFNLGVQQTLDRSGLLRHVDYLSTVSGGGYIGSCLSSFWAGDSQVEFDEVIFSGLPEGCSLSKGKNLSEGRWQLAAGQLEDLTLHLPLLAIVVYFNFHGSKGIGSVGRIFTGKGADQSRFSLSQGCSNKGSLGNGF